MSMDDPLIGKKLGDYMIQGLLGRGGMSRVYRGYDENLERFAAVKVISGDFVTTTEEEYTRRFQSEARAIAHLRHPNIVGIYQFGRWEGIYYMAQVFLEGQDLRMLLKKYADMGQRIPVDKMMQIVRDVANALDYAHEQGVIHRDIKPSNIMLEKKTGRAILMDFGLALSVHEGTMGDTFGSAHYIAPEQAISSAKAVPQSDLYSLGIVIYEMLAGKVPFDDPSVMSVALKHLNEVPPPPTMYNPDLPREVEAVVMRVLDKDPKHRYETGVKLIEALEQAFEIGSKPSAPRPLASDSWPDADALPMAHEPPIYASHPKPRLPQQESADSGGLAGRFARRKARKDEDAAVQLMDENALQIDDATLDSILDSYQDPRDLGLVGPNAQGVTRPEPLIPGTSPGHSEAKPRRRSRIGLLLPIVLVIGVLVVGVWLGTNRNKGTSTPAELTGGNQTATAVALLITEAATDAVIEPTEAATEAAVATEAATEAATENPTDAPTETVVVIDTATEAATENPTETPTQNPTETPTEAASETAATVTHDPNVRLIYNNNDFLLINISDQTLDITSLRFEQELPNGTLLASSAAVWNRSTITEKPNAMQADGCYQLVTYEGTQMTPRAAVCPRFLGYFRSATSDTYFWVSNVPDATFTVSSMASDTPLAICEIAAGECDLYVGPAGGTPVAAVPATNTATQPSVTSTPIPSPTPTPGQSPNLRLIYDENQFLLINTSDRVMNVGSLVFEQTLPNGDMLSFEAQEWNSKGPAKYTSQMSPGGCYQVVLSNVPRPTPDDETCPRLLGWFSTIVQARFFWKSKDPGAEFIVKSTNQVAPLATCQIAAGECVVYLPPQ